MEEFDDKYFERLFEAQFERLMAFVCSYVGEEEVAKDIVQDAFMTLWNNRKKLDESQSVKSYLFAIAQNYALNYIRHRKVIAANDLPLNLYLSQQEENVEEHEKLLAALEEKLKELPLKQREVLEKCVVENKKYKEVAERLDVSVNTVKTQVKHAYAKLREEFNDKELPLVFWLLSMYMPYIE